MSEQFFNKPPVSSGLEILLLLMKGEICGNGK